MNRIVLIGNGFDLAHGLPTQHEDFINWYWDQRVREFIKIHKSVSEDILCDFKIEEPYTWNGFYNSIFSPVTKLIGTDIIHRIKKNQFGVQTKYHPHSPFFESIIEKIETYGWVDIENVYYNYLIGCKIKKDIKINLHVLHDQFHFLTKRLIDYLKSISTSGTMKLCGIEDSIYSKIKLEDISIEGQHFIDEYVNDWAKKDKNVWLAKIQQHGLDEDEILSEIQAFKDNPEKKKQARDYPELFLFPDHVLLLNFNYTYTADTYDSYTRGSIIHIHGELNEPESVIFGYGDELDKSFQQLQNLNENECLRNIKSIKYLESDNYRNVLRFLESAPFQVFIMGHSCGNSDRTLLNTIFEHQNCISIKPYYYQKADGSDNYLDIIQNISRNFTNMKLMRDRVVNKTYCEPLPQANS